MRLKYWIVAILIVHGLLPRLSGMPDKLYREGVPYFEKIVKVMDYVDLQELLAQFSLPDIPYVSKVNYYRKNPPPARPVNIPDGSSKGTVLAEARSWIGTPYVFGDTGKAGVDCSALIQNIFKAGGVNLPRSAAQQFFVGRPRSKPKLEEGDLLFFETYRPGPSHVGIYMGNDMFIHASSVKNRVTTANLKKGYYSERYIGARSIFN